MTTPAGSPPKRQLPTRLNSLIDAKRLKVETLGRSKSVELWSTAVTLIKDARTQSVSNLTRLNAAYDAAFNACLAVLASYDLRTQSGPGHHEAVFAGAHATGDTAFETLIEDSESPRQLRHKSSYHALQIRDRQRDEVIAWAEDVLGKSRAHLVAWDPTLSSFLLLP